MNLNVGSRDKAVFPLIQEHVTLTFFFLLFWSLFIMRVTVLQLKGALGEPRVGQ